MDLLFIAINNRPDRMMYAGPVLSHYEYFLPGPNLQRLTDEEWTSLLSTAHRPDRPDWTRSYLVPRTP